MNIKTRPSGVCEQNHWVYDSGSRNPLEGLSAGSIPASQTK